MDKDSRQKLHNLLVTEKLYSKPFNEFESQFSNPASQKKLYGLLKSEQLYSKSESDFNKQFFADVSTPQKKNPIPTAGTSTSVVTKPSSVSKQQAKPTPSASSSAAPKPVSVIPAQSQGKLLMADKKAYLPGTSVAIPSTEKYNVLKKNWYPEQTKEDITLLTRNARDRAKYIATDIKAFNNDAKVLEQDIAKFNALAQSNPNNPQLAVLQNQLNKRQADIEARSKSLQSGAKEIDAAQATINRKAIENYNQKAKQGNWGGYAWNKIVEGIGDIAGGADEFTATYEEIAAQALDIFGIETDITKEKPYALLVPDTYRKEAKKRMQNIQMPVIESWKSEGTTAEYAQELEKSSSLAKALGGVTGSVPAMLAGPAGMLLQSYGSFYREVESDPVLKNIPRLELDAVALPLSLGMAWLEKTGLASVLGKGAGPITKLVTKALLKVPKNAPMTLVKKTFLELAEKEAQRIATSKIGGVATKVAKSGVGKVAKRLGGGALGEAETETEQGILEDELKRLSNYANDSEAFKVAEFASKEYIDKHLEEAKLGAIGSLILGGPILAVQSVAQGKSISDDDYVAMRDLILDPEQLKLKQAQIALAIAGGQVTKEEGLNELQQLDATRKILKTIPDNLSVESQRQAYGILAKNAKLQQEIDNTAKGIEGKDPNLVTGYIDYMKKKQEEIDANNAELAKLPQVPIKEKPQQGIPEPDEFGRITFEFGSEDEIPDELKALTPTAKGSSTDANGNKKITLSFSQEQINPIRDAIQKQTTSQVPVQPEAGTGLQVAEGEPQAKPQGTTQESNEQKIEALEKERRDAHMAITMETESMTDEEIDNTAEERLRRRAEIDNKFFSEIAELEKQTPKEGQSKEVKDEDVILSGLSNGFKAITPNSFDPRSDEGVSEKVQGNKSFATTATIDGKKYVVVGLKLTQDLGKTTSGRDGYTFAAIEDNGNLPANVVDILTQKAVANTTSVYPNITDATIDSFKPIEVSDVQVSQPATQPAQQQPAQQQPAQQQPAQTTAPISKIGEVIDADNTFTMRGKEGNLFVDDNGQVLFESGDEIVELGNISDIAESELSDFGIEPKAPVAIEIGDDGSIQVSGKKYVNVAEAPMDAITFDEDGNVKSVRLETENGQSRFFRGKRAESIAYQYALQNFEKNATDEQLDNAINQATETTATQTTTGEVTGETETETVEPTEEVVVEEEKPKKSPSAKKILGIKPKMVTVNEMASLKGQLRLQAKAAKTAYDFAEAARKLVATYIKNNVQGALSPADQKAIFRAMEGKLDTPENKKKMIDKITGILQASEGKIAIKELDALGRMLKSMEKGSKLGAKAVADQIKSVVATIKAMGVKNQLKPAQVRLLLNGMAKNLMNATVRDKFLASAQRVLNNAQYAEELLGARKIRTAIRKTLKTGKEIIDVETSVRNFLKLDPKMVEDLDEYMEYANEIFNAVRNVQVKDGNTLGKRAAVLANINAYAAEQNKIQDEINKNYLLDEYNYLVEAGLISGDMSLSEIQSYIASIEENPESSDSTKSDIIREFTKNAFEGFANTVNEMLEDGELDEQDVDFDMVKKFTEMDIESLPLDQQLAAVESLENFIVNGVTSRMGAILRGYTGVTNSAKNAESGMKARPLSYGLIGRLAYLKKITTKGVIGNLLGGIAAIGDLYNNLEAIYIAKTDSLITGLFRSTTMGIKFMKDSGFSGVVRGFVQGKRIANEFAKKYADKFEKTKPNGKAFNDASNVFERGIFADLSRTIKDGTPEQIKKEFDRRMKQLRLTIDELRKTGKKELIEKADLYDSVYQKVKNAKNIEEVSMNIDPINQAAVKEFQDMWKKYYSEFRRMAADYYNIILDEDVNYTPDMYEKLAEDMSDDLITKGSFKMAFDVISTEKVGTFKKNQRIDGLPVNKDTREINRVRDYDFDFNNINALEKTLVDVRTTPSVQQYMGYVNSPYFKEIFPDFDDREMVKKRLKFNIDSLRERQDTYSSKEAKKINRFVSWLSKYGTRIGLGSLASAPKQSIPMIANTAINLANDLGSFGMGIADFWNDDAIAFLENSGYGISLRGAESQTSIDFAEKLIERANQGKVGDLSESLSKLGDLYIEKFLKNPDVTVANMAWLGYYRSKLKSMGYDMDKFDWKTHELNEEAADFAEFKVQDQQNMNISELGGKLLASKDATTKIIRQLLFPFASYQFNLKDKNNRNITMLTSKTSSNQEKITAAKSLVSGMAEAYMFQTIQGLLGVVLLKAAYAAIGYEEPEEEKTNGFLDSLKKAAPFFRSESPSEKWNDSIFVGKSIFEFVAPIPNQLEYVTLLGLNELMDTIQGGTPEQQIKEKKKQEKEASGETGRKRRLRFGEEEDKEAAKIKDRMDQKFRFFAREEQPVIQTLGDIVGGVPSVGVEALYDFGLRSIEAYSGSFKDKYGEYEYSEEQKKILKQSLIPRALVTFNIAPREFLTISNNIIKAVNKKAKEDAKAAKKEESARRTRF